MRLSTFRSTGVSRLLLPHRRLYRLAPLVAGLALCLSGQSSLRAQGGTADKRQTAPEWQLRDLTGRSVKLSDFKGKVVILDFWATWCPPCRKEIPGFIDLQKKYVDKGLVVVGVSLDEQGAAIVQPFVKQLGMTYPVVIGDGQVVAAYGGIEAIPTTFIIDRQGKVVTGHQGYADPAAFEADIKPLL